MALVDVLRIPVRSVWVGRLYGMQPLLRFRLFIYSYYFHRWTLNNNFIILSNYLTSVLISFPFPHSPPPPLDNYGFPSTRYYVANFRIPVSRIAQLTPLPNLNGISLHDSCPVIIVIIKIILSYIRQERSCSSF